MNFIGQNISKTLSAQGNFADRSSPPATGSSVRRQMLGMDKENAVIRQREYEIFRSGLSELLNMQDGTEFGSPQII